LDKLCSYSFPGNIRELKNILVQAIIVSGNKNIIDDSSLFYEESQKPSNTLNNIIFEETKLLADKKKELEKIYIETQLKKNDYNLQTTSEELGLLINNLYRKMKELDIKIV